MASQNRESQRCAVCDRSRGEVAQLIVGPDLFLCDLCVDAANRHARTRGESSSGGIIEKTGLCTFCKIESPTLCWGSSGVTACGRCLDIFNEVLYDAVGPASLLPEIAAKIEQSRKEAEQTMDHLESVLCSCRHSSLTHELFKVNLRLVLRNILDLTEVLKGPEGLGAVRALGLATRKEARTILAGFIKALASATTTSRPDRSRRSGNARRKHTPRS